MTNPGEAFKQTPEDLQLMVANQKAALFEQRGMAKALRAAADNLRGHYQGSAAEMAIRKVEEAATNMEQTIQKGEELMETTASFANKSTSAGDEGYSNLQAIDITPAR